MSTPITDISGIGPTTAATLAANGFDSAEAIASADVQALCAVPGFGPVRAQATIKAAAKIAGASAAPEPDKLHAKKTKKKKSKESKKAKTQPKKKPGKKKKGAKSSKSDKKAKSKKSDKKDKKKSGKKTKRSGNGARKKK